MGKKVIKISKFEREKLEAAGLLCYTHCTKDGERMDANFFVTQRRHKSSGKRCYVAETFPLMSFLGYLDKLRLVKITEDQYAKLCSKKLVTDANTQKIYTYVPDAVCFMDFREQKYIRPIPALIAAINA